MPRCRGKALSQSPWQVHITLKQSNQAHDLCGLQYQTPDSLTKPTLHFMDPGSILDLILC